MFHIKLKLDLFIKDELNDYNQCTYQQHYTGNEIPRKNTNVNSVFVKL